LETVKYPAPLGDNVAYVTPRGKAGKRPAIVWLTGGFGGSVGASAWLPAPRSNDQSARAFREAGIVTMYPALRGANGNLGTHECFLGEVDDVLAAAAYLEKRDDIDPKRIYLGGHSTGGTMALLAAESTASFRAVFALGPVGDPRSYGEGGCMPDGVSDAEASPRAPALRMNEIVTPTFVIEGDGGNHGAFVKNSAPSPASRTDAFPELKARASSSVFFRLVPSADHFSVIAPATEVIARAILGDVGDKPKLSVEAATIADNLEGPVRSRPRETAGPL
jgi:acetyl esterase/lipase